MIRRQGPWTFALKLTADLALKTRLTDKIYSLAWHLEARLMKTALAMALGFALKADA